MVVATGENACPTPISFLNGVNTNAAKEINARIAEERLKAVFMPMVRIGTIWAILYPLLMLFWHNICIIHNTSFADAQLAHPN